MLILSNQLEFSQYKNCGWKIWHATQKFQAKHWLRLRTAAVALLALARFGLWSRSDPFARLFALTLQARFAALGARARFRAFRTCHTAHSFSRCWAGARARWRARLWAWTGRFAHVRFFELFIHARFSETCECSAWCFGLKHVILAGTTSFCGSVLKFDSRCFSIHPNRLAFSDIVKVNVWKFVRGQWHRLFNADTTKKFCTVQTYVWVYCRQSHIRDEVKVRRIIDRFSNLFEVTIRICSFLVENVIFYEKKLLVNYRIHFVTHRV